MNVLQINYRDSAGKRSNGFDLGKQLRKRRIKSCNMVWEKTTNDRNIWQLGDGKYRLSSRGWIRSIEDALSVQSLLFPFSWKLLIDNKFYSANLVHYHLIYPACFSLLSLPFLTKLRPSVWTLHDPWPITGHCVHPFDCERWKIGCGSCPDLSSNFVMRRDHTALMWKIKKLAYMFSNIDIVVASKWMLKMAKKSPLVSNFRLHHIPHGIDLDVFRPVSKLKAKKRLGVRPDSIVISFRADKSEFKGFDFTKAFLRKLSLKQPVCLLAFGKKNLVDEFADKYQIIDLGWIRDEKLLVDAYNSSDLMLMPSMAETFGLMAIEAMACEAVVVAFDKTALPEVLFAPDGGLVVPKGDVAALIKTVEQLVSNPQLRRKIGKTARVLAKKHYSVKSYVDDHIALFKDVIERRKKK